MLFNVTRNGKAEWGRHTAVTGILLTVVMTAAFFTLRTGVAVVVSGCLWWLTFLATNTVQRISTVAGQLSAEVALTRGAAYFSSLAVARANPGDNAIPSLVQIEEDAAAELTERFGAPPGPTPFWKNAALVSGVVARSVAILALELVIAKLVASVLRAFVAS